jgi:protoporphyrinogen/coproporphyrinogen III oxidase
VTAPRRLLVVGGGISGLAAAWAAREGCGPWEVVVLEASSRPGGKAVTCVEEGFVVETGPHGFLAPDPALATLARAAGLEPEQVAASGSARRRFVLYRDALCEVRPSVSALLRLLGVRGTLRLLCEPFVPDAQAGAEPTVWSFAERRVGRRAADRLVRPLVAGMFAGDARRLELAAAFPELHRLATEGSLARGLWRSRRTRRATPANAKRSLASFRRGMGSLADALAALPGVDVRCDTRVEQILRRDPHSTGGPFVVLTSSGSLEADAIVLATEAPAAARLSAGCAPELATELAAVETVDLSVVALGYPAGTARRFPVGYGVLAAPGASAGGEPLRLLGALWEHQVFPDRAPRDAALVRAFYGGAIDPQVLALDDRELAALAIDEQRLMVGVSEDPVLVRVFRHRAAIPQYHLGHSRRVARVEHQIAAVRGLFLAGTPLRGPGFAVAAANGIAAGRLAAGFLRTSD